MNAFLLGIALLSTQAKPPVRDVQMWVSKDVAPASKIRIQLNTRNVPAVRITASRIDGVDWFRHSLENRPKPTPIAKGAAWPTTVSNPNQRFAPHQTDRYYSRQINLPPMKPGVYLLNVAGGGKEAWAVVNVTHLAVVAKRSPKRTLVWVTDAKTGRALSRAAVTGFGPKGQKNSEATTGPDGAALFATNPGPETVVVARGNDLAAVGTSAFDPDGRLKAHFQTDRPIYRPGQTVAYKAILRRTLGQGYRALSNEEVAFEVRDSKDNPLDQGRLKTNAMGTAAGTFEIPAEAATGAYTVILRSGNDPVYNTFTVAEYRKPEFKAEVKPLQKRYLAGEEVRFLVDAQYYFGSPVPQAQVTYTVRSSPMAFYGGDPSDRWFYSGDGNMYPRDTYGSQPFVASDTVHTDNEGKAVIVVKTARDRPDSTYSISATVQDGSRRQVEASGSVPVYAAQLRLGLRSDLSFAPLGRLFPVEVRATDLDGNPAPADVDLRVVREVWVEKKGEYVEREVASTRVKVPAGGKATVSLPANAEGDLIVRAAAKDRTGRVARAEMQFYAAGPFSEEQQEIEQPQLDLRLDRRVYRPGQDVSAYVSTNVPRRPILLTLEGQDIYAYKVVEGSSLWKLKASNLHSPNAYVAATQWSKDLQQMMASQILPVPDPTRKLTVEVKPDRADYRPGDRASVTVTTRDAKGNPVPAEVALAVVDEAIYALSPDNTADLYTAYWGQRENLVQTQMSAPEEVSGGAYQKVGSVAPVRQRFEDTAYWNAFVATGPDGSATVDFEMPGNLTAWRMTGRAVTLATSVGEARASARANRPVQLRLAAPRQIVQGDRITMIGTVDNRSDRAHDFEASLEAEGVALQGPATHRVRVEAKSQSKVEWTLEAATLPPSGTATLTGQVSSVDAPGADNADALRIPLKVAPKGVQERRLAGEAILQEAKLALSLPPDRLEPASSVKVTVRTGLKPVMQTAVDEVLRSPRYSSVAAANQLMVAALAGLRNDSREVREALAMLSRTQSPDGWGWWEDAPTDPAITARVLHAFAVAERNGISVYDRLKAAAREGAVAKYNGANLWEHRALLASALTEVGDPRGRERVDEVLARGQNLSPYARLRLSQALAGFDRPRAGALAGEVLSLMSEGPAASFLPVGDGIGWTASEFETNAQALLTFALLGSKPEAQAKLAQWLAAPARSGRSMDDQASLAHALAFYLQRHPDARSLGDVELKVNGHPVPTQRAKVGESVSTTVPASLLLDANDIQIRRTGDGEAFIEAEARYYVPLSGENGHGIRVLRRYEARNPAGVWEELSRSVKPSEPIRVTVVAWGDDLSDALRVVQPIPSGFEFVDADIVPYGRQEVRDAAVVHYLLNNGAPQTFRYYLRAESEGRLTALPATAEYLRRPDDRGQSHSHPMEVKR
ncbi:MAG TPA: MG2 domain-containing protein [Fimbriimonas sp.]